MQNDCCQLPFCITMLEDGLKNYGKEEEVKVKDIAEILAERVEWFEG